MFSYKNCRIKNYQRVLKEGNSTSLLKIISGNPDHLFNNEGHQRQFKHDRTTSVILVSDDTQRLVIKRYNTRNHWHIFKRALRKSRGRHCWEMSLLLEQTPGLQTPKRVRLIEKHWGPFKGRSYFISQYISGRTVLEALPTLSPKEQTKTINTICAVFLLLASNKISHGDMKASNFILADEKIYLIDLDAARHHSSTFMHRRAYQKDRSRFLKNWSAGLRTQFTKLIPENP